LNGVLRATARVLSASNAITATSRVPLLSGTPNQAQSRAPRFNSPAVFCTKLSTGHSGTFDHGRLVAFANSANGVDALISRKRVEPQPQSRNHARLTASKDPAKAKCPLKRAAGK